MNRPTYRLDVELSSSSEQLWPLVSHAERFDREAGVPPVAWRESPDAVPERFEEDAPLLWRVAVP